MEDIINRINERLALIKQLNEELRDNLGIPEGRNGNIPTPAERQIQKEQSEFSEQRRKILESHGLLPLR